MQRKLTIRLIVDRFENVNFTIVRPIGALGPERRPDGTTNRQVRNVHYEDDAGLIPVFGEEFDRVSFLVVRESGRVVDADDGLIGGRVDVGEG